MLGVIVSIDPFSGRDPSGRGGAFLVLVAFLVSFLAIRTSARLMRSVSWWPGSVVRDGLHIHHLVWGILLMLLSGFVVFAAAGEDPWWHICAIGFGVGAGLTMDEFALWLHLEDVYWSEEGRASADATLLFAVFAGLVVLGTEPFGLDEPASVLGTAAIVAGVLALALMCVAKGRLLLGVVALFVPIVGIVGALRLARPTSPWARSRYHGPRAHRLTRAQRRFASARRGARIGRRLADILTGAPEA